MILPLRTRLYIALGFVLIFLLVAPLLILYTSGYRYDWHKRAWFNPGWIILESQPSGAEIFLNGRSLSRRTPFIIKDLSPDDYDIQLKLADYTSWQKKLTVKNGLATSAKAIKLFKLLPPNSVAADFSKWSVSNNGRWLALWGSKSLDILDTSSGQLENVSGPGEVISVHWNHENNKSALVEFKDHTWALYDGELNKVKLPPLKNVQLRGAEAWGIDGDKVVTLSLPDLEVTVATTAPKLKNFFGIGQDLYILTEGTASALLEKIIGSEPNLVTTLPKSDYDFIWGSNLITLLSKNQQVYVVAPPEKDELVLPSLIAPAKDSVWFEKNLLFYSPDNYLPSEVWNWNADKQEKQLITRLGQPVSSANWSGNGQFIFINVADQLKAIELSDGQVINLANLGKARVQKMLVSRDGKRLYLLTDEAGKLKLQEKEL